MAKFDAVFKEKAVQKTTHPNRKVEWIHYKKLIKNEYQFYSEEKQGIELLADMILADQAVVQNLIIRKSDVDCFEIVAGHRRTLACKYITEELHMKGYDFLPCIITTISEVKARFQLISSNQYRTKTPFEIMKEIEELKFLMENYPHEFEQSKGRLVEKIANYTNMKKTTVGEYQSISNNLGEIAMTAFEEGKIDKSTAVAMASLNIEEQEELMEQDVTTRKAIKEYKEEKQQSVPKVGTKDIDLENVPKVGTNIIDIEIEVFQVEYILNDKYSHETETMSKAELIQLLEDNEIQLQLVKRLDKN